MSDPMAAAQTLVSILNLPKPLLSVWVHRKPKAKPVIYLSLNPKTPKATMAKIVKKIPAKIHNIEIKREKWSTPIDEADYLDGMAKLLNRAVRK